ncbi:hypothetical protein AVEN_153133-1 [Araneus ventricosus]|uniref:Pre-C2HC domain-containing protein n=1 Tax=Araneus ventricosus TaxID=182803 RepID=A0A4Y2IGW6_ARAVE|nr:hypothetical protein AVEN_153133-1 [Araneus ventricosus]
MTEDGRSRSSLSEASDSADSSRSASWYAAVESSRKHTEDFVKQHFSTPTADAYQCKLITKHEDIIDKNQRYAQNCRAAITALRKQGNNDAVIESRLHEFKNYEEKILNSEAMLKETGPCPIASCERHHAVNNEVEMVDAVRSVGITSDHSAQSQFSDFSPFSSPAKIQDNFNFIPVPLRKAAKIRSLDPTPTISTENKFAKLSETDNLSEMENLNPNEPTKTHVPSINLKLSDDYNLTLQEICRRFPKTDNKYSRGFIQITPNSLEERLKIIEFLNQSGKEYILSESPENRPVKIVIKGLPTTHNKELIIKELEEKQYKIDECATKKITFYCLDQEIKAPDSCQISQISFYADSCSLIYKENAVHSIENEKCPLISLLLQRDYSIENCHMNETSGFCLHRANFRNYSSKDMPPCEIQNCKELQMICSNKDPSSYCLKNRSFWILIYGIFVVLYNTSRSTVFTFFDVNTMDLCN